MIASSLLITGWMYRVLKTLLDTLLSFINSTVVHGRSGKENDEGLVRVMLSEMEDVAIR